MNRPAAVPLVLLMLSTASPVLAQRLDGGGIPFRPLDVHIGSGLQFVDEQDGSADGKKDWSENWRTLGGLSLDVGRYWTSHLKTEIGATFLTTRDGGSEDTLLLANGQTAQAFRKFRETASRANCCWASLSSSSDFSS